MTDIEQKALALVEGPVSLTLENIETLIAGVRALAKSRDAAIEQHEAFRQEVSDVVAAWWYGETPPLPFRRFIIIAKPDPLVECLLEMDLSKDDEEARHDAKWLVANIAKRGGKIVWGEG